MATNVELSSGNVFEDLGVGRPEIALAKAKLVHCISSILRSRHLKQSDAAALLGLDQAKVSALLRGNVTGFSTDRLIRLLNALNQDVEIIVRPKPRGRERGQLHVSAAS